MTSEGSNAYINDISDMTESPPKNEKSKIVEFFAHTNVLVTGGTGFLGKLLIERLLRSCPGITTLYMFARSKKGKSALERFNENFEDFLYDRLRREQPNFLKKVVFIEGDITQEDFGVTPEVFKNLMSINIIFHAAATVRFDESFRVATTVNVKSIRNLLLFAKKLPDLRAFVHVSTAYSHCIRNTIDEKHYETPFDVDKLISLVDILNDDQLQYITPKIIDKWPNMYAFSKAVGECTVLKYSNNLPVCIVRPSIVISTSKEPVAAWTNNVYGATGVAVGSAVGLLHTLYCKPEVIADVIPADYVISNIIASAWDIADRKIAVKLNEESYVSDDDKVPVYNCVSSCQNPISWGHFMKRNEVYGFEIPSVKILWYYMLILNRHLVLHKLCQFFFHFIPAVTVDSIAYLIGRKPMLLNVYKKVNKFSAVINYFCTREWKFRNDNVIKLWKKLDLTDQEIFNFNVANLNWEDYFYHHMRGLRLYMLKDPLDTIPEGHILYRKLCIAHYTIITTFSLLLAWLSVRFMLFLWYFCPLSH